MITGRGQRSKETALPKVRGTEDTDQTRMGGGEVGSAALAREGATQQNTSAMCKCFYQAQAVK